MEETVIGGGNPDYTTLKIGWIMWVPPYSAWEMCVTRLSLNSNNFVTSAASAKVCALLSIVLVD